MNKLPILVAVSQCALGPRGRQIPALVRRKGSMKRTWTIVGVSDVWTRFRWYQMLLGQPKTSPAHDHFGQFLTMTEPYFFVSTNGGLMATRH